MFTVKVQASFSSAHNLKGYKGKCEELHGHNWSVELAVSKSTLDKIGMALDFSYLKGKLHEVLERLDHKYLNDVPYFKKINPTSENIAKYIYDTLKPRISNISSITVWESDNSSATYHGE
jgi:6-pyruvoyltetrahydropterin/6-carboxytetrahydropterin synthase